MAEEYYAVPAEAVEGIAIDDFSVFPVGIDGKKYFAVAKDRIKEFLSRLGCKSEVQWKNTDFYGIYAADLTRQEGEMSADPVARQRARFVEFCRKYKGFQRIDMLQKEIDSLQKYVQDFQQKIVGAIRQVEEKRRMLRSLENDNLFSSVHFEKEFESIRVHSDVEEILIGDSVLAVHTKPIFISYQGTEYHIGRFIISLCLDGKERLVAMHNRDRRVGNFDHPHVKNRDPCLGNISKALPELIAEHRYSVAIALCIQFLKSYEKSADYAPYADISNWA